jgi:hypothetical protein
VRAELHALATDVDIATNIIGSGDAHPVGAYAGRQNLTAQAMTAENWAAIFGDGSMDLVVRASIGDEIVAQSQIRFSLTGGNLFLDFYCVNSGRMWSSGVPLNNNYYSPFVFAGGDFGMAQMRASRRVLPSDLDSSGFVILRPFYRVYNPSGTIQFFDSVDGGLMQHEVRNFGSDRRVLLSPGTSSFHKGGSKNEGALQEPTVWQDTTVPKGDPKRWNMLYSGGWTTIYTGWQTAPTPRGPWTDRGLVLGNGKGGASGQAARNTVYYDAEAPVEERLTVFYSDAQVGNRVIQVAQGADPASLVYKGVAASPPSGVQGFDNSAVLKDDDGTYVMMVEGTTNAAPGNYVMGIAKSNKLLGPYTVTQFPVAGLGFGKMYGGPVLFKRNSVYVLWFHAGFAQRGSANQFILPTEGVRATSADLVNWKQPPSPIIKRAHPYEVDQVADVFVVKDDVGHVHLYWTANDNENQRGYIMYADPAIWRLKDV